MGTTSKGSNGSCLASFPDVHSLFLYSSDIFTYYYAPHVYIFILFVYVMQTVINIVSCVSCKLNKLNLIERLNKF